MRTTLAPALLAAGVLLAPVPGASAAAVTVVVDAPRIGIRIGAPVPVYVPPPVYVPAPAYLPPPAYPPRVVYAPPRVVVPGPVVLPLPPVHLQAPPRRHWRHAHRHHAIVPVVGYVYPRY
jgi:hypothetical protein